MIDERTGHVASMGSFDVIIVGAGLSGIDAAATLRREHPHRRIAVLEARPVSGGTWDLFRYPGIRSDSDMYTFGYGSRPWPADTSIAQGGDILDYLRDTAREAGVDEVTHFEHRVHAAAWSSDTQEWSLRIATPHGERTATARFLMLCTGYYRYDEGYTPALPGIEKFDGTVVHPQHWPEDLDYAGKRVVVIGSGATAVTLLPSLAETAAQVTMLQRSPTYIASIPSRDRGHERLRRLFGQRVASRVSRWRAILRGVAIYGLSRRFPDRVRRLLRARTVAQLPEGYDVDTHFTPRYDPWDQRLCATPDGDFFAAIRSGKADVATGHIDTFTPDGVVLQSGQRLPADIVVTATGLNILVFGGIRLTVDSEPIDFAQHVAYKGTMLSGIPNLAFAIGYTNSSWTLKIGLVDEYVSRLLRYMDRHGFGAAVPTPPPASQQRRPLLDFGAGYVRRSIALLPQQGSATPWTLHQNYLRDFWIFRFTRLRDVGMRFVPVTPAARALRPAGEKVEAGR